MLLRDCNNDLSRYNFDKVRRFCEIVGKKGLLVHDRFLAPSNPNIQMQCEFGISYCVSICCCPLPLKELALTKETIWNEVDDRTTDMAMEILCFLAHALYQFVWLGA